MTSKRLALYPAPSGFSLRSTPLSWGVGPWRDLRPDGPAPASSYRKLDSLNPPHALKTALGRALLYPLTLGTLRRYVFRPDLISEPLTGFPPDLSRRRAT
jgi:hypothetical protein